MNFNEIKAEFVTRCKDASSCEPEFKRVLAAGTLEELLHVIKDSISWCINQGNTVDAEYLEDRFTPALCWANGIYTSGKHDLTYKDSVTVAFIGSSSATIKTYGSSSATIKTYGSSSATIKTYGSSSATIETWGSSSATIETWYSSSATIDTWGSSSATIDTWGSSSATIKTYGSSSATIDTHGSSSATIKTGDSRSKLSYTLGDGICPLIKHLNERKIYVRKNTFEVVEV